MLGFVLIILAIAAILAALHFRWNLFRRRLHPWLESNANLLSAYRSVGWLLTVPIVLVGGYLGFLQLHNALSRPDAALVFASPASPRFWITNPSSKLVREPKYQFLVYDLSRPGDPDPRLNLEIPVKILDFIRPRGALGPWTIQSVARRGSGIEKGDHLFGYAQVQCPDCERVRYYWLFVQVGNAGWYAEVLEEETKAILRSLASVVHGGPDYLTRISEVVPQERRIAMGDDS